MDQGCSAAQQGPGPHLGVPRVGINAAQQAQHGRRLQLVVAAVPRQRGVVALNVELRVVATTIATLRCAHASAGTARAGSVALLKHAWAALCRPTPHIP